MNGIEKDTEENMPHRKTYEVTAESERQEQLQPAKLNATDPEKLQQVTTNDKHSESQNTYNMHKMPAQPSNPVNASTNHPIQPCPEYENVKRPPPAHRVISITSRNPMPSQKPLEKAEKKAALPCTGWCCFVFVGVLAIIFMACIYNLGGSELFPVQVNIFQGLIPIEKQGKLEVLPFQLSTSSGIQSFYKTSLPPLNITGTIQDIEDVLHSYPKDSVEHHRNCFLENPSFEQPCNFDTIWFDEICNKKDNFGYVENNGTYSPCFIIKFENTSTWEPVPFRKNDVPKSLQPQYDPSFFQVLCSSTYENGVPFPLNIEAFPTKGFSILYFPVSMFDPKYYLPPIVAIKVKEIPAGKNIAVHCMILARNAMILWNNGAFTINFQSTNTTV